MELWGQRYIDRQTDSKIGQTDRQTDNEIGYRYRTDRQTVR